MSEVGHVGWEPVYRVRTSTDKSVLAVAQPINASAAAITQLQATVDALEKRVKELEQELADVRLDHRAEMERMDSHE